MSALEASRKCPMTLPPEARAATIRGQLPRQEKKGDNLPASPISAHRSANRWSSMQASKMRLRASAGATDAPTAGRLARGGAFHLCANGHNLSRGGLSNLSKLADNETGGGVRHECR